MLKNKLKIKLISWALLSLKSRHTCGTIPIVVRNPPTNPISSFQSKYFLPLFYHNNEALYCLFILQGMGIYIIVCKSAT